VGVVHHMVSYSTFRATTLFLQPFGKYVRLPSGRPLSLNNYGELLSGTRTNHKSLRHSSRRDDDLETSQKSHGTQDVRRGFVGGLLKEVIWIDDNGRKRRSLIKNNDGPEKAHYGVPKDAPDVRSMDMEAVYREIEALQYEHGLFDWRAANQNQGAIQACINVFKRKFLELYRNQ
jgi:hypothetical protein